MLSFYVKCVFEVMNICVNSRCITHPLASSKTVLNFDNEMLLHVTEKRRRCAYCSTKEADIRSNIECFTCKLSLCLKDEKNCFFDYHKIFMWPF
jgi:hypothetical protein